MHDEGPHTPTLLFVSQGATREKAGEEKDRDTHQGGDREKVHAREKGEQRKRKRATKPRKKQGVASSRARDARREGGTAGTRHTAHGRHHTAPKHQRGEHQRDMRKEAPRTTTRTAQTPHTPHTPTSAPTARGQRAPAARPEGGQPGEAERLTPDAPDNGGRHPPRGRPTATPTARNAGPQGRAAWGRCWDPIPAPMHPAHTGRGTLAARPRGRTAGGGTAPDTSCPSQQWQATPPGDGPPPSPRHAAPTGHAGQRDSVRPPHPHTRAHSTWVADPNGPPSGRAVGGGGAPDLRRPSQQWKAPPPGMPFRRPHREQRRPARAHAVGPVLGPHACTDRTRDTRVAEPRRPAPEGGRPLKGTAPDTRRPSQRWQAGPPGDGPPPAPRHAAPTGHAGQGDSVGPPHPRARAHSMSVADPNSPPSGRAVRGGGVPDLRRPSQRWKAPPPGTPFRHPHCEQGRPARAHAVGPVLGPTPAPTSPGTHGSRNPGRPPQRTGSRGRDSACHQTPLTTVAGQPPRGRPPATPTAGSPHSACRPRGQCWAPTPTHPRPQHVGGGPQQPAQWAGSRGRGSA